MPDAEAQFLQHLEAIDRMARAVCRRNGLSPEEGEEFTADVRLRLCEDDYAVIHKFRGSSSLATYLSVVIGNLFRDYRIGRWGKWRPSAQARRLGEVAMRLETLMYRDGYSFDAACHVLEHRNAVPPARTELRRLHMQLPARSPRMREGGAELETLPSTERADTPVLDAERDARLADAGAALREALAQLPDEDRLIMKLLYYEGMSVADVARGLNLEQKPLYPRIKQLHRTLAAFLRGRGVTADVLDFLAS